MSETKTKWVQFTITTVIGIAWNTFDRWAKLQPVFESWLPWVSPLVYVAVGGAFGYMICSALHKKQLSDKDAEIARLTDENLALQKQLQMQKVPGAVTALQTVAVAASRSTDQVRAPSGKYYCNMRAVRQLRTETIEAMLDAFDSNEPVPFGCHERAVRRSIEGKEGIFVVDTFVFGGASTGKETGRYKIAKEWRDFMDDADVLAEMRSIVRNAGPVWHEI